MTTTISWSHDHGTRVCVLRLAGEIDLVYQERLRDTVEVLTGLPVRGYVVDLSAVTFMGCTGVNALVALQAAAAGQDRPVVLVQATTPVMRMLDVLQLAERLPRARDVAQAVCRLQAPRAPLRAVPDIADDARTGRR
jgi:anti-sigma B factor antagonist